MRQFFKVLHSLIVFRTAWSWKIFCADRKQQVDTTDHFAPCAWGRGNDVHMAFPGMLQASGSEMKEALYFSSFWLVLHMAGQSYTFPGSGIINTTSDVPVGGFQGSSCWSLYIHFQVVASLMWGFQACYYILHCFAQFACVYTFPGR